MTVTPDAARPGSSPERTGRRWRGGRSAHTKVGLGVAAAAELLALIDDEPGTADETVLDQVDEAVSGSRRHLPGEVQRRVATGEAVAFQISPGARDAILTLIREDRVSSAQLLRQVARRLRRKLREARKRRRGEGRHRQRVSRGGRESTSARLDEGTGRK